MRVASVMLFRRPAPFGGSLLMRFQCLRSPRLLSCVHATAFRQHGKNESCGGAKHEPNLPNVRNLGSEFTVEDWTLMPLPEEAVEDIIPEPIVPGIERKWNEKMKQRQDLLKAESDGTGKIRLKDRLRKKNIEARKLRRKWVDKSFGANKGRKSSEIFFSECLDSQQEITEKEDDTLDVY